MQRFAVPEQKQGQGVFTNDQTLLKEVVTVKCTTEAIQLLLL
jgi:hypothetical protein